MKSADARSADEPQKQFLCDPHFERQSAFRITSELNYPNLNPDVISFPVSIWAYLTLT